MLILGCGRIGKCLAPLARNHGAAVTISARKEQDLLEVESLGYRRIHTEHAHKETMDCDVIINTIPALVIPNLQSKDDAIILELASVPGLLGDHITVARGLPGKMDPKASGKLIAETFLRLSI